MAIQSGINQLILAALGANKLKDKEPSMPKAPESKEPDVSKMKVSKNVSFEKPTRNPAQNLMLVSQDSMLTMGLTGMAQHTQKTKSRDFIKNLKASRKSFSGRRD